MPRTRITFTNDATRPRILDFGGGILWYAYLRGLTLYAQREVATVRDPEVAIATPVTAFDLVADPAGGQGWIVFLHDGVVERVQVTNLAADPLTSTVYVRSDNWYEPVGSEHGAGTTRSWDTTDHPPLKIARTEDIAAPSAGAGTSGLWNADDGPDPPVLLIEWFYGSLTRTLSMTLPDRTKYRNRRITAVNVYRKESELAGWTLYGTVPVGPSDLRVFLSVPITGTPITWWFCRSVRVGYQAAEGPDSNHVFDDGALPPIFLEEVPAPLAGAGTTMLWALVDNTPLKVPAAQDTVAAPLAGAGTVLRWVVNGSDILNP